MDYNVINIFTTVFSGIYILVLLLFIIIFIAGKIYATRENKEKKYKIVFENDVENFLKNQKNFKELKIEYLEIINLVISEKLQKYHDDEEYISKIQQELVDELLMPKIIRYYNSKDFMKRYNVVLSLSHAHDVLKYEKELIKLINDSRLIVKLNAAIIGCKHATSDIVEAIIKLISKERDHVKKSLVLVLEQDDTFKKLVFEKLKNSQDPYYSISCYTLLHLNKDDKYFYELTKRDVKSNFESLKLEALEAMIAIDDDDSHEYILSLLKSPDWKVRNKIFKAFKKYNIRWAIDKLGNFVNDDSAWVRGSAIETLVSFGEEGNKILNSLSKNNEIANDIKYYRMKG